MYSYAVSEVSNEIKSYVVSETAILQSTSKKFSKVSMCDDKNCQSTRKHSYDKCHVRLVSDDKNCQSARCAHLQKPAMPQSSYKKSSSKKF